MNSKIKAWEIQTDGKMDNDVNMKQQGAEITAWEEGKTRDHAFFAFTIADFIHPNNRTLGTK